MCLWWCTFEPRELPRIVPANWRPSTGRCVLFPVPAGSVTIWGPPRPPRSIPPATLSIARPALAGVHGPWACGWADCPLTVVGAWAGCRVELRACVQPHRGYAQPGAEWVVYRTTGVSDSFFMVAVRLSKMSFPSRSLPTVVQPSRFLRANNSIRLGWLIVSMSS